MFYKKRGLQMVDAIGLEPMPLCFLCFAVNDQILTN